MPSRPSGACDPLVGNGGAHVAALGDVAGVAKAAHQLRPCLAMRPALQPSSSARSRSRSRQRRDHEIERVLGAPAVRGRIGQRPDDSRSSMTDPGHPCVTISGSAFSCDETTWMKWTSSPSISVVNCG